MLDVCVTKPVVFRQKREENTSASAASWVRISNLISVLAQDAAGRGSTFAWWPQGEPEYGA